MAATASGSDERVPAVWVFLSDEEPLASRGITRLSSSCSAIERDEGGSESSSAGRCAHAASLITSAGGGGASGLPSFVDPTMRKHRLRV